MKDDPLYPIFNHNLYLPGRTKFPKISYETRDFVEGIDSRVRDVLRYIDSCIETYGEDKVIINEEYY